MNETTRLTSDPVHITVTAFRGRTMEQKRDLVRLLTEAAADVLGVDPEAVTIELNEGGPEDWSRGGILSSDRSPA